jgi:hypothetical protein
VPFCWVKDGISDPDDEHCTTAYPKLIEHLYAELDRRVSGEPCDDLIGGPHRRGRRAPLTREDVIDITFLRRGLDTVTSSVSMVDRLARHPTERDRSWLNRRVPVGDQERCGADAGGTAAATTADFEIGASR